MTPIIWSNICGPCIQKKRLWPSCSSATASEVSGKRVLQQEIIAAGCRVPPTPFCSWAPGEREQVTGEDVTVLQCLSPFQWIFSSEWSRQHPMSSILKVLEVAGFHEPEEPGMLEGGRKTAINQISNWGLCTQEAITTTMGWALLPHGQGRLLSPLLSSGKKSLLKIFIASEGSRFSIHFCRCTSAHSLCFVDGTAPSTLFPI